jgi:hypothetical protein
METEPALPMFELSNREYGLLHFDEEYDLEAQLAAIRGALTAGRDEAKRHSAEIERIATKAKERGGQHLVDLWADECHASIFQDAARSAAAIGMLAPFVENLFTRIYKSIGRMGEDVLGHDPGSERSTRAGERFWDPHVYFGSREIRDDLVRGIVQLGDAAGLRPHLPADLEPVLEALFEYRNRMFHNGFEWPPEERAKFENRVKAWPKGWFECATSGDKPWVWTMSDGFIGRVVTLIDEVLDAAGQHVRLHYDGRTAEVEADTEKLRA